jgi:hypothetical protein
MITFRLYLEKIFDLKENNHVINIRNDSFYFKLFYILKKFAVLKLSNTCMHK